MHPQVGLKSAQLHTSHVPPLFLETRHLKQIRTREGWVECSPEVLGGQLGQRVHQSRARHPFHEVLAVPGDQGDQDLHGIQVYQLLLEDRLDLSHPVEWGHPRCAGKKKIVWLVVVKWLKYQDVTPEGPCPGHISGEVFWGALNPTSKTAKKLFHSEGMLSHCAYLKT